MTPVILSQSQKDRKLGYFIKYCTMLQVLLTWFLLKCIFTYISWSIFFLFLNVPCFLPFKCMKKRLIFSMGRGWQGTVNSSASVNPLSSSTSFKLLHRESDRYRCNRMENEALAWPSKCLHCLAQDISSFTPTGGETWNKKPNQETKASGTKGPYLAIPLNFPPPTLFYTRDKMILRVNNYA